MDGVPVWESCEIGVFLNAYSSGVKLTNSVDAPKTTQKDVPKMAHFPTAQ